MVTWIQRNIVALRTLLFTFTLIVTVCWMFAVTPVFAADVGDESADFRAVPGGMVKSTDDLIAALGGESICSVDDSGNVLLKWDIELTAPIVFSSGSYTIYGAGNIVKIDFVDKAAFKLENDAELSIGKKGNSKDDVAIEIVASGKKSTASVIECNDDSVLTLNSGIKISSNNKDGDGGAVYAAGKNVTLNGSIFSDNSAVNGGAVALVSGNLSINDGIICRNKAVCGGGIYVASGASLSIIDGKIGGEYDTDAIEADFSKVTDGNEATNGGGIYVAESANFSSAGGTVCSNIAEQNGGGVYIAEGSASAFYSTSVIFNTAENGGAVYTLSETTFSDTSLCYNRAYGSGGGIWNDSDIHLVSGSISVNSAERNGGGVFNAGYVELVNAGIYDNVTGNLGGGIYNEGKVDFGGGYISRNECTDNKFGYGLFNLGELNMAGIAYAGVENPITLVKRNGNYTFINVVAEFNGGITMASIETVSEVEKRDGTLTYTLNGDVKFSAVKGDADMVSKAVSYLVVNKYKSKDRTLDDNGNVVLHILVQNIIIFAVLILLITVVTIIGVLVMVQYRKTKK